MILNINIHLTHSFTISNTFLWIILAFLRRKLYHLWSVVFLFLPFQFLLFYFSSGLNELGQMSSILLDRSHERGHLCLASDFNLLYFLKDFMYLSLERRERRQRGAEISQCWEKQSVASRMPPTGGPACNPGVGPDQGSNQWPFGSQASTQSTEPHLPGLASHFKESASIILPLK